MSTSAFDAGTVFQEKDRRYQVIEGGRRNRVVRDLATTEVGTRTVASLRKSYVKGQLQFEDLTQPAPDDQAPIDLTVVRSLGSCSERQRGIVRMKLHYLKALCPQGHLNVQRREIQAKLNELHQLLPEAQRSVHPPAVSTFYLWRKQWVASSFSAARLVNRYDLRGRRPKMPPAALIPILDRLVDQFYASANRPTVKETLDQACAEVDRQNYARPPIDQLPHPTRRQLEWAIRRLDRYVEIERRYGTARARTATRIFVQGPRPTRLGERVEIDHTPLDVLCISDETGMIVGRPHLTTLIDEASRMIYGAWISFRPPNASTVLRALKQAILPKEELLKELRIDGEWPTSGVMSVLVCDNGKDFLSQALEGVALDLGLSLVYCPPRQPFYKGSIERFLKEINYRFIHLLPGTTFSKVYLREDYDSVKNSVIPFGDLRRLIYRWIVEVYSRSFHRGIQTCPLEKWKELAAQHGTPALPRHVSVLEVFLAPNMQRSLGSKGIEINGLYYTSAELVDLRHRLGNQRLDVRPNVDNLASIHVLHPETHTYFEAACTDLEYASGVTLEQHVWLGTCARRRYAALPHRSAMLAAKRDLHEEAREMLETHRRRIGTGSNSKSRKPVGKKESSKRKTRRSGVETQSRYEVAAAVAAEAEAEAQEIPVLPAYDGFDTLKPFESDQSTLF